VLHLRWMSLLGSGACVVSDPVDLEVNVLGVNGIRNFNLRVSDDLAGKSGLDNGTEQGGGKGLQS
jgi:hypothetical protein